MTTFLLKCFIKNYSNVSDRNVREAYGILGGTVGIICNLILFAVKFVIGIISNSLSVITDSFNNLSDVGSSVVTIVGAKAGNKPADEKHPFGHGRVEYISGLIVAFIILFIGLQFFISSVKKIFSPEVLEPDIITFVILGATVLVKLWLSIFNKKLGKAIQSDTLSASSIDSLGDVLATTATIVSLFLYAVFEINIDSYIGALVACVVLYAGFSIAMETLSKLIGESADPHLAETIQQKLLSYPEIIGCHDLIIHNYGPNRSMASIHAEVPDNLSIHAIHNIIDLAEREISNQLDIVIVIHMDPIAVDDLQSNRCKKIVSNILSKIDTNVTMHDFRLTESDDGTLHLSFDIVLPYSYTIEKEQEILAKIEFEIKQCISNSVCFITIDKSFIKT